MTSSSRVQLQPAYVLHQRPYRDTSAIVEIFSEAYGRRSLVARGLKRPKSRLKGLLQPFQPLLISWVGKSELGTLTDAELYAHSAPMRSKYLPGAFYLNELLLKLLHKDDPHSDIFITYHKTLNLFKQLPDNGEDDLLWQAYLRQFEIVLMQSIGYGLVLDHDVQSQLPINPQAQYEYVPDYGPVMMGQSPIEQGGVTVSGQTLLMLADCSQMIDDSQRNAEPTKQLFKEAKRLLRTLIDSHLGNKNLHSRELFVSLVGKEKVVAEKAATEKAMTELSAQETG